MEYQCHADKMVTKHVRSSSLSGVTRRGEVRQLPQGAKRQGALRGAFGQRIVCFALQNSAEFLKRERS